MVIMEVLSWSSRFLSENIQVGQIISWLENIVSKYGYLGVFLMSFIGSSSIIFPIPYTVMIFMLGGWFDPNLLALLAGAGSALGEILGYLIGYYGGFFISEKRRKQMEPIIRAFRRYGAIVVFIFALTPLPDDLLLIPLGIMRISFIKVFLPCIFGKIVMCFILAYGGRFSIGLIREFAGSEGGESLILITTSILLIALIIVIFKVDWEKLLLKGRL
ncbi:MAG: VTT domain-containing protein [Candidatus Bathyarchaeia archaeon]